MCGLGTRSGRIGVTDTTPPRVPNVGFGIRRQIACDEFVIFSLSRRHRNAMTRIHRLVDFETGKSFGNMLELHCACYHLQSVGRAKSVGQKRTVEYQGRKVQGEVVEFEAVPENWTPYRLSDGTILKMRLSLLEVVRLLDEFQPQSGDPVYLFTAQTIVSADSPETLKQKKL